MAFGLDFFTLAPGLRVAGDSLAYIYKFTKKGGQGDGKSRALRSDSPTTQQSNCSKQQYPATT